MGSLALTALVPALTQLSAPPRRPKTPSDLDWARLWGNWRPELLLRSLGVLHATLHV